jgi:predicted DNA-binding transcriptional regulator YafY
MNRLDRLTALLIQLQSKRIVRSHELAERFGISLRTVYRDIRTLELAGIPILGEAGVGYSLMPGYRLPPVQFNRKEAMSFVTAEKLISKLTDNATRQAYESALYKIKAVLRSREKELLDDISRHIEFVDNPYLPKDRNQHLHIEAILSCVVDRWVIRLEYLSAGTLKTTQRDVEPVGIYSNGPYWHLIAWCRLRRGYRNFRIDRIQNLQILTERFTAQHPYLKQFVEEISQEKSVQKAVIRLDKKALRYLGDQHYYNGFVSQTIRGEQVEMVFLTPSLSGLAHWFLLLGESADVVEPSELKQLVLEKIGKIRDRIFKVC